MLHPPGPQPSPQPRNSAVNLTLNTNNHASLSKHCADDRISVVWQAIICLENASNRFPFKNKYRPHLITEWLSICYILSKFYTYIYTHIILTFINPIYHKNLLKCSYVDFQGREVASICSESTQVKGLRNTRSDTKKSKKTNKLKKKLLKVPAPKKFLLLLNYSAYIRKHQ